MPITTDRQVKVIFTQDEIKEKSRKLAYTCQQKSEQEEAKKSSAADFKAKIEELGAQVSLLSNHVNNGYEYRMMECTVHMNDPVPGKKTILRPDTGEIVAEERMTQDEMQEELDLKNLKERP